MHWIDWAVVAALMALIFGVAIAVRQYTKSVADFLAAGRMAGRYLLTLSQEAAGLGAITIIATFEMYYNNGFVSAWWGMMGWPIAMIIAMTGFVIYRFRQTRALTLAEFFEMRYSRNFRLFAGFLIFISSLLAYGIFPGVTARFIIHFCGLPHSVVLGGALEIPTFPLVMIIELGVALWLTLSGGQITVMITDFIQAMFCLFVFLVIGIFVMVNFEWADVIAGLQARYEPGKSLINPLDSEKMSGFNVYFFLIATFGSIYGRGGQHSAYNSAPKTPHEARMSAVLKIHRSTSKVLVILLLPPLAYAILHLPKFAEEAAPMHAVLEGIADDTIRGQMTVPVVLNHILPIGVSGLFAGVIVAAAISTDDTRLHSIGGVFVQDVIMPFRRTPLSPRAHMLLLRLGIVAVAVFAFFFSLHFKMKEFVNMFMPLVGSIYGAGAGAVIIGGLYWKRGTTTAAWAAAILGAFLAVVGLLCRQYWEWLAPNLMEWFPNWAWVAAHQAKFPIAGIYVSFAATVLAIVTYVLVSFCQKNRAFNMDRMLHRGKYAAEGEAPVQMNRGWRALAMGPEFTFGDKIIYVITILWIMGWWTLFIFGTFLGGFADLTDNFWSGLWEFKIWLALTMGVAITIWFSIGGIRDMVRMLTQLRVAVRDARDDGWIEKAGKELPDADAEGDQ